MVFPKPPLLVTQHAGLVTQKVGKPRLAGPDHRVPAQGDGARDVFGLVVDQQELGRREASARLDGGVEG